MAGEMTRVLTELDAALVDHAGEVARDARRSPVSEVALDVLREALAPVELPADLETFLRWSDGLGEVLTPHLGFGGLADATSMAQMATLARSLHDGYEIWWPDTWLPVFWHSEQQLNIDLSPGSDLALLWGIGGVAMEVPSLAAALRGIVDLLQAGVPLVDPETDPAASGRAWSDEIDRVARRHYDWTSWPYDRRVAGDASYWPERWRAALPQPLNEPPRWREPTPIASLDHGQDSTSTIEGYFASAIEGVSASLLKVRDRTGQVHIWVPRAQFAHWQYEAARGQFEIRTGPGARAEALNVIDAHLWHHTHELGVHGLVLDAWPGIQGRGNEPTLEWNA